MLAKLRSRKPSPRLHGGGGESKRAGHLGHPDADDVREEECLSELGRQKVGEGSYRGEGLPLSENLVRKWRRRGIWNLASALVPPGFAAPKRERDVARNPRDPAFDGNFGSARGPAPADLHKAVVDKIVHRDLGHPSRSNQPAHAGLVFEVQPLQRDAHVFPLHHGGADASPQTKSSADSQPQTHGGGLEHFGPRSIAYQVYTAAKHRHDDAQPDR